MNTHTQTHTIWFQGFWNYHTSVNYKLSKQGHLNKQLHSEEYGKMWYECIPTLLKIKVLQKVLHRRTSFGSTKNCWVKGSLKNHLFLTICLIWRTFFHHKEPFVIQKVFSDVKGCLWNHLDKKVILWNREAPLFLRVNTYNIISSSQHAFLYEKNMTYPPYSSHKMVVDICKFLFNLTSSYF